MVLESLIECYTHLEEEEEGRDEHDASSSKENSAAEKVRAELYEWRRTNVKRIDLMSVIHQEPTQNLHQFIHDSTKFQETADRVHALMHTQQKAKNHASGATTHTKTDQEA